MGCPVKPNEITKAVFEGPKFFTHGGTLRDTLISAEPITSLFKSTSHTFEGKNSSQLTCIKKPILRLSIFCLKSSPNVALDLHIIDKTRSIFSLVQHVILV